ncbi:MAG: HAD hydrolase-like protein [Patescibacteria group bacterium]
MDTIKTILFDFDGTIADTLSACIQIANKHSKAWGFREVKDEEIESLKGLTPLELLREFKIPFYKLPFLVKKVQLELFEDMDTIKLFPGMTTVINDLHKKGFLLGIVTSNSEKNVRRFLKANNINCFQIIHNEKNIFGKSRTINNVIKTYNLKKEETIYVGDEVRDIEASKKVHIQPVSVTWGFNSKQLLEKYNNQYLVDTPADLFKLITK